MTESGYAAQIRSYLLGELSEEELEAFEQRFFSDDDVFSDIEAAEMALVDSYVRREMPPDERARFEANYLVTPERRAKASEARLFHDELERSRPPVPMHEEKAGWLERMFGGLRFSMSSMQFAGAALILILTASTGWLIYDGWRTKQELLLARNSLANSEATLNDQLAAKERELQDQLAAQRGEDSETLAALQDEINSLQRQLDKARRNSILVNPNSMSQRTPVIATVLLAGSRGGNLSMPITLAKEMKILNLRIPLNPSDGNEFDVSIAGDSGVLFKETKVAPRSFPGGRMLSLNIATTKLKEGNYKLLTVNEKGEQRVRSFVIKPKEESRNANDR